MKKNKSSKTLRQGTEIDLSKSTVRPSSISIGEQEKILLRYLYNFQDQRFSVRGYSKLTSIARSTIYSYLDRLEDKEFVERNLGDNRITKKGIEFFERAKNTPVETSRSGCRRVAPKRHKLSTHYHKFKYPIKDKSKFNKDFINNLNPIEWYENKLHNLHQIIIRFEDATVMINPKQVILHFPDTITESVDQADMQSFSKAIEYTKKLIGIGISTDNLIVEEGHWARVQSYLSDFLSKIDNKYFLDLGDGKKLWIDYSVSREDETNDKNVRERIDEFLTDVTRSDKKISDIDKIIKALEQITKLEVMRTMNNNIQPQEPITNDKGKIPYVG